MLQLLLGDQHRLRPLVVVAPIRLTEVANLKTVQLAPVAGTVAFVVLGIVISVVGLS